MTRNTIKNVVIAFLTTRWMMTWPVWLPDAFEAKLDAVFFVITMSGIIYYCIRDLENWLIRRHDTKELNRYLTRKGVINDRVRYIGNNRVTRDR